MVVCLSGEYFDERNNCRIPKQDTPTFEWNCQEGAENEALRLAKKTGKQFAVLQAISKTHPMPVPSEYKLVDCL